MKRSMSCGGYSSGIDGDGVVGGNLRWSLGVLATRVRSPVFSGNQAGLHQEPSDEWRAE